MNSGKGKTLKTGAGLRMRNIARFYLARLHEQLWLKPLISCVLSLLVAFVAGLADAIRPAPPLPDISTQSLENLLAIISSSMLMIAVFAVGAMLSAYASASTSATPRSFPLVVGDDVSQNALSIFIGAFIFSIVAQTAIHNGFYGPPGRFVLFVMTVLVLALVILGFVRWVDRIARLGRLGNTIYKVEAAVDMALKELARLPTLGATRATAAGTGAAIHARRVGYVQNIDVARLQRLAEQIDSTIVVCALPGTFATPGSPLAYIADEDLAASGVARDIVIKAFVIGDQRTFESDPRFGLIVLSETASRALSPAVNDPGTAIDIIGALVRLFVRWNKACRNGDGDGDEDEDEDEDGDGDNIQFDRVVVGAIALEDMFDDAFRGISRDGAGMVEVGMRLQMAFQSLSRLDDDEMRRAAIVHSQRALRQAEKCLSLPEEREAIRALATDVLHLPGRASGSRA